MAPLNSTLTGSNGMQGQSQHLTVAPDGRVLSPGEVYIAPEEVVEDWKLDLNVRLICPDCQEDPPNLVEEFAAGDTVCASCGRVLAEHVLDTRQEWRTFSGENESGDDPSRIGLAANPLLEGSQLSTSIAASSERAGSNIDRTHRKTNRHVANEKFQQVFSDIDHWCTLAHLSRTVGDMTKNFYTAVVKSNVAMTKTKPKETIGCCMLVASRNNNEADSSRGFRFLETLLGLKKNSMNKVWKVISKFLQEQERKKLSEAPKPNKTAASMTIELKASTSFSSKITTPIPMACQTLGIPIKIQLIAEQFAGLLITDGYPGIAGRQPASIAGAIIYFVSNLMNCARKPSEIGKAIQRRPETIRSCYAALIEQATASNINGELYKAMKSWAARGGDVSRLPPTSGRVSTNA